MFAKPLPAIPEAISGRRHDLDWIRVAAFLVLILYHVGMYYGPWDWHVKTAHPVEALVPQMLLVNPWRLTLLFVVSGCATRFMADGFRARGKGGWALAGSRTLRLLPPILFGMFVIVPPQSYYEVLEAARHMGMTDPAHGLVLQNFWPRYATGRGGWCDPDGCLVTPTWNHLWFVVYLLPYNLILVGLDAIPAVRRVLHAAADRAFKGVGLLLWPALYLIAIRLVLAPRFEVTHALIDDWYNHALSFAAFLFGYLIARSEDARQGFIRWRWSALMLGLACWLVLITHRGVTDSPARDILRLVYALDQISFIAAVLGFGARWLNRGGPVLRYVTVGVFPFYIVHQTIIITAGHNLARLGLPLALEAALVIAATFAGCLLAYEAARRAGWLGLLLGVAPKARGET